MEEKILCLRCQALQTPRLFDGLRYECEEDMIHSEDLDIRVASISDLRKQPNCRLCCLLAKVYHYEQTNHNAENEKPADHFASRQDPQKVQCVLRPTRADLVMQYDGSVVSDRIATHLLVEFDPPVPVMFHTWDQGRADAAQGAVSNPTIGYKHRSLYRGWTIAPDLSSASWKRPLMNRFSPVDEIVNLNRLKVFLDTCEHHHSACNRKISAENHALESSQVVLLDVKERRIVRANIHTRYVALSYVWDLIDREGYEGFREGFKEGSTVPELPCIMEDAAVVVEGLGERYLWIDLLCIDQNDPVKKKIRFHK